MKHDGNEKLMCFGSLFVVTIAETSSCKKHDDNEKLMCFWQSFCDNSC